MKQNIIFEHKNMRIILLHLLECKIDFARRISIKTKSHVAGIGRASAILKKLKLIREVEVKNARQPPFRRRSKIRKELELTNKGREIAKLLFEINQIKLPKISIKNIKSLLNYGEQA